MGQCEDEVEVGKMGWCEDGMVCRWDGVQIGWCVDGMVRG